MEQGTDQYRKAFEAFQREEVGAEPAWLRRVREEAMAAFLRQGFPTARDEAWRYTDVTPVREASFVFGGGRSSISGEKIREISRQYPENRILFVNGRYFPAGSSKPKEFEVFDLREAMSAVRELEDRWSGGPDAEQNAFKTLNTAFLREGVLIRVPEGTTLTVPLRLIFVADPGSEKMIFQPRVLVLAGKRSSGILMEHYHAAGGAHYFTNVVLEIDLQENAMFRHYKVQDENRQAFHIASTWVSQARGSQFSSWSLAAGSRLMRNDCRIALEDENAECSLRGLYLGGNGQHLDLHTTVDHRKPAGKSTQLFKGLLGGKSRGVFGGRVRVRQGAVRTDATQTNKNLLLSDEARVDSQPQLEIDADDVKCSHGAAVGQLREEAVFYLRSRGIGEREASRILARGFAQEVVDAVETALLKKELEGIVNQKLEAQFLEM